MEFLAILYALTFFTYILFGGEAIILIRRLLGYKNSIKSKAISLAV